MVLESLDKTTLAELCGKALFGHDNASAALGIKIVEITQADLEGLTQDNE